MSVLSKPGPSRRKILTPYVMIWLAIASFAVVYLALLGLKPHMFATAGRSAEEIEHKIDQARLDMQRGLADLDPLRRTVGEVKMDVANLKVAAEEASAHDQVIMEKVAALENAVPKASEATTTSSTNRTAVVPPTPKPKPSATSAARPTTMSGSSAFAPPVGPSAEEVHGRDGQKSARVINGEQNDGGPIETGSIERTPQRTAMAAPAAKPKAPAKPKEVGVVLATGPTIDSLRLNWSILNDRYADTVRNMQPRYVVKGTGGNRTYRLVVGPVASTAEAKTLCKDMETRGMPCEVSTFSGNAL